MRRGFYKFLVLILIGAWLAGSAVFFQQNKYLSRLTGYFNVTYKSQPVSLLKADSSLPAIFNNIQPASFSGVWENFKKYLEPPQVFAHPYQAGSECQWNIQINGPGGGSVREYVHNPSEVPFAKLEGSAVNSKQEWEPCGTKFEIRIEVFGVEPNSSFTGWSGACVSEFIAGEGKGFPVCRATVDMSAPVSQRTFIANFSLSQKSLSLNKPGAGYGKGTVTGVVTSGTGPGISCDPNCSGVNQAYDFGTKVALTASAAADGSSFYSWSGDCDIGTGGTSNTCSVTINANKFITAIFKSPPPSPAAESSFTLYVTKSGNGSGVVSGSNLSSGGGQLGGGSLGSLGAGINCGADCEETYKGGSFIEVPLSATPDLTNGSSFEGWSGACESVSGNSCVVEFRCGVDDGSLWTKAADLPFSVGVGHKTLIFSNKIWALNEDGSIWSSADGVSWTKEVVSAPWGLRRFFGAVVYDNKMWVMGGSGGGAYYKDVWNSADGKNWDIVTPAALWPARDGHAMVVFNGKMWVIGGRSSGTNYFSDVWSSINGFQWTQATSNAGTAALWNSAAEVFNGKIFISGGGIWLSGFGFVESNEVHSSADGVTWDLEASVLSGGTLEWKSVGHTMVVFDNKLWVLGGTYYDANNLKNVYRNDIWRSSDGKFWTKVTKPWGADWSPRAYHNSFVLDGKMWVIGGYDNSPLNNIWYSIASSGGCSLTKNVDAKFKAPVVLDVEVAGAGAVNSSPSGISNCQEGSGDCSEIYPLDTVVNLQAIPSNPSTFAAWTGCGVNPADPLFCSVAMNGAKLARADFYVPSAAAPDFTLNLSKLGPGTVLGPGINCGAGCSQLIKKYNSPTTLTLSAVPDANANFLGWAENCSGAGDCLVEFACPAQYTLTINKSGEGKGTVTGSQGLGCSAYPCGKSYVTGSIVNLVAAPDADSVFTGWSGVCADAGSCVININSAKTVTVNFDTAPSPPAQQVSGVCMVKGIAGTANPGFYAPDVGPTYAKLSKPGINTLNELKTACTVSDYSSLLSSYCTQNSDAAQRIVITYDSAGNYQSSTCDDVGCSLVSCP